MPVFKSTMKLFNQKIVNASRYSSLCINMYNNFDFFVFLGAQFHCLTHLLLYSFFLSRVRGNNTKFLSTFYKPLKLKVNFADIAGNKEEKLELVEIVDYLKNSKKYKAIGVHAPKGVLLYGPPGTGKTLLAGYDRKRGVEAVQVS